MNNSSGTCPQPYLDPPACNVTIAEHFGRAYTIYNEVYAMFAAALFILLLIQFVRLVKSRGLCPIVAQKVIHIGLFWPSLGFIAKSVDPNGWKGTIPPWAIQLITDTTTAMLYSLITVISFAWIKIVSRMNPARKSETRLFWIQCLFQMIIWCICTTDSLLLSLMEERWKYRILQMASNAGILLCVFGMALHQGFTIYSSMNLQIETLLRNSGEDSSDRSAANFPTKEARKEVAKRLLKVLVCGTTVILPVVFFQLVEAFENAKDRYTNDALNPRPLPSSVLSQTAFEIFQYLGCLVLLFIFHNVGRQQQNQGNRTPVADNYSTPRTPRTPRTPLTFAPHSTRSQGTLSPK